MKLNKMKKEELETLSYTDLTEMILKEKKKSLNTPTLFKEICKLLELTDEDYANQIGDYYTSLTTDKRFILLDNACWDVKDKHKVEIIIDDDEDEEYDEEEIDEDADEVVETVESEDIDAMEDEEGVDTDDDLDDLTIIDDDDLEDE